jgi:hypothetical protein
MKVLVIYSKTLKKFLKNKNKGLQKLKDKTMSIKNNTFFKEPEKCQLHHLLLLKVVSFHHFQLRLLLK